MAKVVLDIPRDKMQSFIKAVIRIGINSPAIKPAGRRKIHPGRRRLTASLKKISSSFILFDWEFFSNELEYE